MSKCTIQAGWDDCPHLTEEAKESLLATIPPYQRDARRKGIPTLGAGAIYPLAEEDYLIPDFVIPDHWRRAYGLDVGWNRTAAVFGALNDDTDILYVYSEHYAGEAIPAVHAEAIKARGAWIPGVIDPAARGRSQIDGSQLVELYKSLGLDLDYADNSVSAGLYEVWQRFVAGKLKVFASCGNLRNELRLYRRDEKGKIVKKNDHAVDSLRYLVKSGLARAIAKPAPSESTLSCGLFNGTGTGWMA